MYELPQKTVPCKYCGIATQMLNTKMCDGCWELDRRVSCAPWLSIKIALGMYWAHVKKFVRENWLFILVATIAFWFLPV